MKLSKWRAGLKHPHARCVSCGHTKRMHYGQRNACCSEGDEALMLMCGCARFRAKKAGR